MNVVTTDQLSSKIAQSIQEKIWAWRNNTVSGGQKAEELSTDYADYTDKTL